MLVIAADCWLLAGFGKRRKRIFSLDSNELHGQYTVETSRYVIVRPPNVCVPEEVSVDVQLQSMPKGVFISEFFPFLPQMKE